MVTMKNCEQCHVEFIVSTKNQRQRFCTKACYDIWQRRQRQNCACPVCGTSIILRPSEIRMRKTCSVACGTIQRAREHERWITLQCDWCHKDFQRHRYWKKKQHAFCSRQCYGQWVSSTSRGENHTSKRIATASFRGKNWKMQVRAALVRDEFQCIKCHAIEHLDVHHIVDYHTFSGDYLAANVLENLETLCRRCHFHLHQNSA